jgi:hypothetical protein
MRRIALLLGLLAPATIAAPADLGARLAECAALDRDRERLTCYDALAGRDPRPDEDAPTLAERTPEENFGVETLPVRIERDDEPVDRIRVEIAALRERPRGELVFELANGQRWTQVEVERARYREGETVTIERTRFGAYMLRGERGGSSRVRRID